MAISLATWNINSVRLRINLVLEFLKIYNIDILCLQETKCRNDFFPLKALKDAGYNYIVYHGEKSYNGVAIISRIPITQEEKKQFCNKIDCRHISVVFAHKNKNILLHNFYVPAGGDIPNIELNAKFKHKLEFLEEMKTIKSIDEKGQNSILMGDLNIAPLESDVWSHKQLLDVVSHTPIETNLLQELLHKGGWVVFVRHHIQPPQKVYSWWSYRAKDWQKSNRGRRLDHIWIAPDLIKGDTKTQIAAEFRSKTQPSDHVPVIAYI